MFSLKITVHPGAPVKWTFKPKEDPLHIVVSETDVIVPVGRGLISIVLKTDVSKQQSNGPDLIILLNQVFFVSPTCRYVTFYVAAGDVCPDCP